MILIHLQCLLTTGNMYTPAICISILFVNQHIHTYNTIHTLAHLHTCMHVHIRVPQALLYFGILSYDDFLLKKLQKRIQLHSGSEEEVEIRGCSVWAVEVSGMLGWWVKGSQCNLHLVTGIYIYTWSYHAFTHSCSRMRC